MNAGSNPAGGAMQMEEDFTFRQNLFENRIDFTTRKAHKEAFLGLPNKGKSHAYLLEVPLEKTVSYGKGTKGGPSAIVQASVQLELFEEQTKVDFAKRPVVETLGLDFRTTDNVQMCLAKIGEFTKDLRDKFILSLGGEHTLTFGVITGLVPNPEDLTIIQVDAHADMADTLGDKKWSHGTVMRRLREQGCKFIQLGIRSLSLEESDFIYRDKDIKTYFAYNTDWAKVVEDIALLEGSVYLSIDVDGLDPSIMPSTGTPQPNGLEWKQLMNVITLLSVNKRINWLGADIVEYIPSDRLYLDIIPARLALNLLAWKFRR